MAIDIKTYIQTKFPREDLIGKFPDKYSSFYYENQVADAVNGFYNIKKYLKKDKKILEVGGGIHFLSNYLAYLKYNITSIEPGGFRKEIDLIRRKIIKSKEKHLIIKDVTLEKFSTDTNNKFDFIFSINVLEHTKNINLHLLAQNNLMKNTRSLCHVRCPNYSFPFESHFYLFYIPFLPMQTFKIFYQKKLLKLHGKERYLSIINSINFNCTYFKIKKLGYKIRFFNAFNDILTRLAKDEQFKKRILSNKLIYFAYKVILFLNLNKIFIFLIPTFLCPYLIFNQRKY
jgi:hypothetical protein